MPRGTPFQTRISRPGDRGQVICPELGLLILNETKIKSSDGEIRVRRQRGEGVVVSTEAVHEDQRQLDAVRRPRMSHLINNDVEEALVLAYRQQRLGLVHAHRRTKTAIELDDH